MNIETSIRGNTGIVVLTGRMDADQATEFENACKHLTTTKGGSAKHIVAELTGLKYVSSMGIRAFLMTGQAIQKEGGEFVLVGMGGFVKQVFDMTRITPMMRLAGSVEEALKDLA